MKLTIERAALFRSLGHVQSIVERRNTIPILSNVLLTSDSGQLGLTATDMDIAIVEGVDATIETSGSTTAPAHTLYDIVRKLPDGAQIELDTGNGDGQMTISSGPLGIYVADVANRRLPANGWWRPAASVRVIRRGIARTDRPNTLRDLDGRDPLLSQWHFHAYDERRRR